MTDRDDECELGYWLGKPFCGKSIVHEAAILPDGSGGAPCGACRELMVQLMPEKYKGIQIMIDYKQERIVTLGELTPEWWI